MPFLLLYYINTTSVFRNALNRMIFRHIFTTSFYNCILTAKPYSFSMFFYPILFSLKIKGGLKNQTATLAL